MEIDKLNLSVLKKLLKVFANKNCDTILLMDNFTIDGIYGRYYSIKLNGDYLCCKCSDGRVIEAELDKNGKNNDSFILKYKYSFDNSSSISNNIPIFKGNTEHFDDDIDLISNSKILLSMGKNIKIVNDFEFRVSYLTSYLYSYDLDEKDDFIAGEWRWFRMVEDGIIFDNGYSKYLIANDLSKIISINGKKAPTYDECNSFKESDELEKIRKIFNENKDYLHPFIVDNVDCIKDVLDNLFVKNLQKAEHCRKTLIICKKELERFKNLIENLNKRVFLEKEIEKFVEIISISIDKHKLENKSLRKILK